MTPRAAALLLAFTACTGSREPHPAAVVPPAAMPSTSPPPSSSAASSPPPATGNHWWHIVDASSERSLVDGDVLASRDQFVFVDLRGRVHRKPAAFVREDAVHTEWSLGGGKMAATLERFHDGTATLLFAMERQPLQLSLRPEGADRSRELDALEERERPPPDVCDRAARCCPVAFEALRPGTQCNLDEELGLPHDPELCLAFFRGIHELFEREKREVPAVCR
jgi:hypothetical protein